MREWESNGNHWYIWHYKSNSCTQIQIITISKSARVCWSVVNVTSQLLSVSKTFPRHIWILRYKFKILRYKRQRTSLNVWIVVLSLSCLSGKYISCSSHFIVITLILVIWAIILSVPYGCLCTNSLAIQQLLLSHLVQNTIEQLQWIL